MTDSLEMAKNQVWLIINTIPKGKVATYGQIARLAGMPQRSRWIGRVLSQLPSSTTLPWHRVVNSQGKITNPNPHRQQQRLEEDGIVLLNGRVKLRLYQWQTD